jgi:hypothetical protein
VANHEEGLEGYIRKKNYLFCKAALEILDEHQFILSTQEYKVTANGTLLPFREVRFAGILGREGRVTFQWPEHWSEEGKERKDILSCIRQQLNVTGLQGPGLALNTTCFRGSFDGKRFSTHFEAAGHPLQEGSPAVNPMEDGLMCIDFAYELNVVD